MKVTSGKQAPTSATIETVWRACCTIIGDETKVLDPQANLNELGLDSLGLAELVIQLEEQFGDGSITIDDIIAGPFVADVAARLQGAVQSLPPKMSPVASLKSPPIMAQQPTKLVAPARRSPYLAPTVMPTPEQAPTTLSQRHSGATTTASTAASPVVLERINQLEKHVLDLTEAVKILAPHSIGSVLELDVPMTPLKGSLEVLGLKPNDQMAEDEEEDEQTLRRPVPPSDWIQTTHVGSLPRATGELKASTVIEMQRKIGVSVINDGEWSRDNYVGDMLSRIANVGSDTPEGEKPPLSCLCEMPVAADMLSVPVYAQRFTGGNGLITLNPKRVAKADTACTGMPYYLGGDGVGVHATLGPFLAALDEAGIPRSSAFWSVPSPGTLALFCEDRFFKGNTKAYVTALAEAVKPEYQAIAATGIKLQVDCPDLAMGRHTKYTHLCDDEFHLIAKDNVEALNDALGTIPAEQVRVHVCWGNYAGPHDFDIASYLVWPHVANIRCGYVLTEGANPRHGHEVAAYEHAVSTGIIDPSKLTIIPGVIDTTAARVEHPALIADRLLRYVRAAGHPSRVMAGTDCGFASTAKSAAVTGDIAWKKVEALIEGAALATQLYMQAQAPVPMKAPTLSPTPYRTALLLGDDLETHATHMLIAELRATISSSSLDVILCNGGAGASRAFEALRWAVDFPLALVACGDTPAALSLATAAAEQTTRLLAADSSASRRPLTIFAYGMAAVASRNVVVAGDGNDVTATAARISSKMLDSTGFDRRTLALGTNPRQLPTESEVVVIGGGLLGMVAATRLRASGHSVVILEQRSLIGGIWSMHANSTSQVNSSEGGYCLKEFLPESSPRKHAHSRDHSTAAEVLADLSELGASLRDIIHTQVQVVQVLGTNGDYHVICSEQGAVAAGVPATKVIKTGAVVLAINDRVGMPRSLSVPGMKAFKMGGGVMADGTSDLLKGVDWRGKRVVVFGMGAFAVENVRTALEAGAAHVTVVARRLGTVCPKMIDYLNFVKPWDNQFRHETATNVKQLKSWRETYRLSGATPPEVWPGKIKHEGHTISVSDVWFVGHHLGKMATKIGMLERMEAGGCVLSDGTTLAADIVVGCIGFERNTTFCEQLTGRSEVKHSNYLDKNMIYLADAEIDESAFNYFFGSSVLEYAKFYTHVFVEGLERPEALGPFLWGENVATCPVKLRKWTQYIELSRELIKKDAVCAEHAARQVEERTKHFYRTMPPETFVEVNRKEWEELHTRLNGGVPVAKEQQLPYTFGEAATWCLPTEQILA